MEIKEQLKELEEKVNLGLKEAYRKMAEFKKKKQPVNSVTEWKGNFHTSWGNTPHNKC